MTQTPSEAALRLYEALREDPNIFLSSFSKKGMKPKQFRDHVCRLIDEAFGTDEVVKAIDTVLEILNTTRRDDGTAWRELQWLCRGDIPRPVPAIAQLEHIISKLKGTDDED